MLELLCSKTEKDLEGVKKLKKPKFLKTKDASKDISMDIKAVEENNSSKKKAKPTKKQRNLKQQLQNYKNKATAKDSVAQ